MSIKKTLYDILGIEATADQAEISAAHRKAAKQHHPDVGGDREQFEEVSRAWMVLRDPEKRARYDATGETDSAPDNTLSDLANIVTAAFDAAMQQCNAEFDHVDIVASMKKHLRGEQVKADVARQQINHGLTKMARAIDKLSFKGSGPNVLLRMLEQRIGEAKRNLAQVERSRSLIEQAMAMAGDYQWAFATPPQDQSFGADLLRSYGRQYGQTNGWT